MDWLIDPQQSDAADAATSMIERQLRRRAAHQADIPDGVRAAAATVREHLAAGGPEPVWIRLDWPELRPTLTLRAVTPDTVESLRARGVRPDGLVPVPPRHRSLLSSAAAPSSTTLPVDRARPEDLILDLGPLGDLDLDPARDRQAAATVAIVAAAEAHPAASAGQLVALAGAALADTAAADAPPTTAQQVADLFCRTQEALGGDPYVLEVADDRLELGIGRCPFGGAATQAPSLCGISATLAGRLAARVNGRATVVSEETLDASACACSVQVWLGEPDRPVVGQTFTWPPESSHDEDAAPRMQLSASLPRESGSVPIVRRLSAQALRAFGVDPDDIHDVELAITEACANVVEHAVDGDSYEVTVELAADHCAITVLDRGSGFDHTTLPEADPDSEDGRGIFLMQALVDKLAFTEEPQTGAVVHMVKSLRYDGSHPLHAAVTRS